MASPPNRSVRAGQDSATRYRQAADLVIEQLDWCISYLHQIRKPAIARGLQQNRDAIVKRYRD